MNSQEYRNLSEAYLNVYQEIDERVLGQDPEMRRARTKDEKRLPPSSGKEYATNQKKSISYMDKLTKNNKIIPGMTHEEVEEFDEATAMAKRGLNEPAIRNKIASKTGASGAGSFADKATALAGRETYGNKGMKAGRENLARKQRGDFRNTTSSSPGLRGYGHQSSDPAVKAKQDARGNQRARAALTPNERKQLNMSYDLYDVILAHLLAEGYADTNENALVIMANMSEDWKQCIVEAASDQSDKQIEKGVKTTYKAGNVLDNLHQGRSKGLNKLPRGEREEKAKRMRYRLKTRRDDLFGERNKREDETRAEMKRKYGL
jgi:hypothetical protein